MMTFSASKIYLAGMVSLLLVGCGGGSQDTSSTLIEEESLIKGVLYDSAVAGAKYRTSAREGVTDKDGIFEYKEGDEVEFFVGNISLGTFVPKDVPNSLKDKVKANKIVTPYDLAKNDDNKTIKIAQFLLSLDRDQNVSNGIEIEPEKLKE